MDKAEEKERDGDPSGKFKKERGGEKCRVGVNKGEKKVAK